VQTNILKNNIVKRSRWQMSSTNLLNCWKIRDLVRREWREKKERKKRKEYLRGTLKFWWWYHQLNLMASMMTGVGHVSNLMASEPQHLWTVHMVLFVYRLLSFLVLLNSSHRYLFNDIENAVIGILVCFRGYFYLFFLSSFVLVICEEKREKKAKKKKYIKDPISIPKLWWRHY